MSKSAQEEFFVRCESCGCDTWSVAFMVSLELDVIICSECYALRELDVASQIGVEKRQLQERSPEVEASILAAFEPHSGSLRFDPPSNLPHSQALAHRFYLSEPDAEGRDDSIFLYLEIIDLVTDVPTTLTLGKLVGRVSPSAWRFEMSSNPSSPEYVTDGTCADFLCERLPDGNVLVKQKIAIVEATDAALVSVI